MRQGSIHGGKRSWPWVDERDGHSMHDLKQPGKGHRANAATRLMFELLGPCRLEFVSLVAVSSILSGAEGILHPLLVKSIFDDVVIKRNFHTFIVLVLGYLALGLFVSITGFATGMWGKSLENRVLKTMSRRMLASYYQKEYASILRNGHGYFINRIYSDLREGFIPMLTLVQTTIKQTVLLVCFSAVLVYLSWRAFLFLVAIIPISAGVGALLGKRIRALTSQEREQEGGVLAMMDKAISAFRMVNVFSLFSRTAEVVEERIGWCLATSYQRYKVTRGFQALNDSTMVISDFLAMFVGALFVLRGALTFGGYLAFVNTFWRAVTTLMQLFNRMADFQTLGVVVDRVASFLSASPKEYYGRGRSPSVRNIRFSYGDVPILNDFSLQLSPGEKVVIVGPNGSGKTTLAHILSGYLAPSEGEVVLPQRISSVTLPIAFPPLKVKELISDTRLVKAFRLDDHAILESSADELSAGQQQKLAIALALSQPADLYVIDEPLANLDPASRDTAIHLILEKTEGKTLILIMHGSEQYHRLFDRVITIDLVSGSRETYQEESLAVSH
jgi:ABC-type bacteriocin/lantibiotic exporter with double-glycine peptidase domain